jgi:TolA-binding protein
MAIVTVSVVYTTGSNPMNYKIGNGRASSEPSWIETTPKKTEAIEFEDGSTLMVKNDSALEVVKSHREGVIIKMANGRLSADIRSAGETLWELRAGPYTITVLGTAFDVSWDAAASILDVKVLRGTVLIRGQKLDPDGIKLTAGEQLQSNSQSHIVSSGRIGSELSSEVRRISERQNGDATENVNTADDPQLASDEDAGVAPYEQGMLDTDVTTLACSSQSWRFLYAKSNFEAVVDTALKLGLENALHACSKQALWDLVDAARRTGRIQVAEKTLGVFRKRFAGSKKAMTATFLLGRIAMEQSKKPASARKWFSTYLKETPDGALSEEALGRLIELHMSSDMKSEADKHAKTYLSRYPGGQYAKLAESLLEE